MEQAGFLLQQQHFQQVAHRLGVADDGVPDGLCTQALAPQTSGLENGQLAQAVIRIRDARHAQGAGIVELSQQHGLFAGLVELAVGRLDARHRQQFVDHFLVLVRTLTQVHRGQMKTEHLHRADQRVQARAGQRRAVVRHQRRLDGAQVSQEFGGTCIGVLWRHGVPRSFATRELGEGGSQAGVDAGEGPTVRFILPVGVAVGRTLGQGLHGRADAVQHRRHRQLGAQQVHLREVVAQHHVALAL